MLRTAGNCSGAEASCMLGRCVQSWRSRCHCWTLTGRCPTHCAERAQSLPLLDIDWEVPEIGPSGNLDSLLGDEAAAQATQQRVAVARAGDGAAGAGGSAAAQHAPKARAGRVLSSEAPRARTSGQGLDSGAAGGDSVCQPAQQQRSVLLSRDSPATGGVLTSPRSVATSCQQPEGSCNSGGGGCVATPAESAGMTAGGSVGNPHSGSACPSPGVAMPEVAARRSSGGLAMPLSPFGSVIVQRASPAPPLGSDVGAGGFGNVESLPLSGGFGGSASHSLHPPQQQPGPASAPSPYAAGSVAGSYGLGPAAAANSLPLSSGGARRSMQYNSPTLVGMQHLGLSDGGSMAGMPTGGLDFSIQAGRTASPPVSASVSLSQQQAAAMQGPAGPLTAMQQFPQAALHAGGGLSALLGSDDSGSFPLPSPFAGGGGSHQQYGLPQQPANLVCTGAAGSPAGFSAVPMSNQGSMGGLTITTGSQQRIHIATSTAGHTQHTQQQFAFDVEAGEQRKRSRGVARPCRAHGCGPGVHAPSSLLRAAARCCISWWCCSRSLRKGFR